MDERNVRARWAESAPRLWLLKCRACDGGEVLGAVQRCDDGNHLCMVVIGLMYITVDEVQSRSAAQRAVRRALREEQSDAQKD